MANATIQGNGDILVTEVSITTIIESATQGPQGIPGIPGVAGPAESTLTIVAGETLTSNKVVQIVTEQAYYADSSIFIDINKAIGITKGAANLGDSVDILTQGILTGFTGLISGTRYYLSNAGTISNIPPSLGFVQQIGIAISATEIVINIQPGILLV